MVSGLLFLFANNYQVAFISEVSKVEEVLIIGSIFGGMCGLAVLSVLMVIVIYLIIGKDD